MNPSTAAARPMDVALTYRAYSGFVFRVLGSFGLPPDWVEDAAQEVFIVACRRPGTFHDASSIRSWLFSTCRRIALKAFRQMRRGSDLVREDLWYEPERAPDQALKQNEAAEIARRVLREMHASRRMVFVLAELEGMTGPEIAEALNLKLNTVYSRLRTARIEFNEALREIRGGEDPASAAPGSADPNAEPHAQPPSEADLPTATAIPAGPSGGDSAWTLDPVIATEAPTCSPPDSNSAWLRRTSPEVAIGLA